MADRPKRLLTKNSGCPFSRGGISAVPASLHAQAREGVAQLTTSSRIRPRSSGSPHSVTISACTTYHEHVLSARRTANRWRRMGVKVNGGPGVVGAPSLAAANRWQRPKRKTREPGRASPSSPPLRGPGPWGLRDGRPGERGLMDCLLPAWRVELDPGQLQQKATSLTRLADEWVLRDSCW